MDSAYAQELIRRVLPAHEVRELPGTGSFGSVFSIRDALNERAVKVVPLAASLRVEHGKLGSASVASRFETPAEPGEILISESLSEALGAHRDELQSTIAFFRNAFLF